MTVSYNEFHKRRFSGALPSSESDRIDPSDIDFDAAVDVGATTAAAVLEEEEEHEQEEGGESKSKRNKKRKKRLRRVMFSRDVFSFKDGKSMGLRDRLQKETLFSNGFANPKQKRTKKIRPRGGKGKKRSGRR